MSKPRQIRTHADIAALREILHATAESTRATLRLLVDDPGLLSKLKLERLGHDPLDLEDRQNIAEQIDQHATHEVALDALEELIATFPGRTWKLAAGARASGHDIESDDGQIAAEVFAAVNPSNNQKLSKDLAKIRQFSGQHRFVFYRSQHSAARIVRDGVNVVSFGPTKPKETR